MRQKVETEASNQLLLAGVMLTVLCQVKASPVTPSCEETIDPFGTGKEYCVVDLTYTYEDNIPVWPFSNVKHPVFKLNKEFGSTMKVGSEEFWYCFSIL